MTSPRPDRPPAILSLEQKEEQLRLAVEAADMGLWDVDVPTGTLFWPPRVKAMFGISPEAEATLDDFVAGLHPQDAPAVLAAFAAAQDPALRTVYDVEYRTLGKEDGRERWVAARGRGLFDASGRCVRAIGTAVDITVRKQAEALQREARRKKDVLDRIEEATRPLSDAEEVMQVTVRLLGEHLGVTRCAYADVDADNDRFTIRSDWSPGAASSAGVYSLDRFGLQAASSMREGRPLVVEDVARELGEDGGRMFEAIGIRAIVCAGLVKHGRLVAMMAIHHAAPRRWSAQEVALVTEVVGRCWTHIERVRSAAMLREQDRRKDEFLVTLAHELRNPIAPMLYAIALMKRENDLSRQPRRLEVIERQAHHMVRLVDDLLDVSRISRGVVELKREVVDVAALLDQAVEAAAPGLRAARHTLAVRRPDAPVHVHVDPARLVQSVTNLLNNAVKYTPDGGDLRLAAWAQDARVVIEVADNGMGIPPDDHVRLFELFTQLPHTGRKAHGGLGIGLSIVKRLIEMHGGTIGVRSAGLNEGATFRIELPRAAPAIAPEARPAPVAGSGNAGRVLVVEDNPDGLRMLVELIEASGHAVRGAADGAQALRIVAAWRPDLVLLDLGLPSMDGHEVAARLRGECGLADTPIVALTGWGTRQDKARTAAAGFADHLTKPVTAERLLQVVDTWIGRPAGARSAPA